jgi:mercuric ion binding protein
MKRILIFLALLHFAQSVQAAERTATFSIPGMTCALCPLTVRTAMGKVAGVKSVDADFATKSAVAVFEDTVTSLEAIAEASANAGYPASLVSIK